MGDISILEEPFVSKVQGKECGRDVLGILRRTDCRGRWFRRDVGDGCEKAGKGHIVRGCSDRLGCGHYLKLSSRGGMMIKATFKEKEPNSGVGCIETG